MNKILQISLITSVLATAGFAEEDPVGVEIYDTFRFEKGEDKNDTTLMPSADLMIGGNTAEAIPAISSTWNLEEGSLMRVDSYGFVLNGELNINPKNANTIWAQKCINHEMYYKFKASGGSSEIYQKVDGSGEYVDSMGTVLDPQPDPGDLSHFTWGEVRGSPISYGSKPETKIDMNYCVHGETTKFENETVNMFNANAKISKNEENGIIYTIDEIDEKTLNGEYYIYDGWMGSGNPHNPTDKYALKILIYSKKKITDNIGNLISYSYNYSSPPTCSKVWDSEALGTDDIFCRGLILNSTVQEGYYVDLSADFSDMILDQGSDTLRASFNISNVKLKAFNAISGRIVGGTVTYVGEGGHILSKDGTSFEDTSLSGIAEENKFVLETPSTGYQEEYIKALPKIQYTDSLTDPGTPDTQVFDPDDTEALKNSEALRNYFKKFGLYPDEISVVSSDSGMFSLLASKTNEDAIKIPTGTAISETANDGGGSEYQITANLHNIGEAGAGNTFQIVGTPADDDGSIDTLILSGDNSNLNGSGFVKYKNVNVKINKAQSWIPVTTDFEGGDATPTLTIADDLAIDQNLSMIGANLTVEKGKTLKMYGSLTLQ